MDTIHVRWIVALSFIGLLSCSKSGHSMEETAHCPCAEADEIHKDKLIDEKTAKQYYELYSKNNYDLINTARAAKKLPPDGRSAWYSIEELEAYLAYVKEEMKEDPEIDKMGIRFYFGTYPDGQMVGDKNLGGYQNFFLYPMLENQDVIGEMPNNISDTLQIRSGAILQNTNLGYNLSNMRPPY